MLRTSLLISLVLFSPSVFAKDFLIRINNMTMSELHYVYVSPSDVTQWEDDLLDEDEILTPESRISLTLEDYDSPFFDVRAIDENGDYYYRYKVNAESQDVVFYSTDRIKSSSEYINPSK